jgi:hypothetical protein
VAEIGDVIEMHLRKIGLLDVEQLDEHQKAFIEQKKAELARQMDPGVPANEEAQPATGPSAYPDGALLCDKCQTKAMIQMDGCMTCLNCGESKCG